MTIPKPRAVIFDWDDTIIDSWGPSLKVAEHGAGRYGTSPPWSDDEARRRARGVKPGICSGSYLASGGRKRTKFSTTRCRELFLKNIPVFPE